MHIPEKYRDRYDALALSHPWMREMQYEPTNGIADGTNGIADGSPLVDRLPEGDAVSIMRDLRGCVDVPMLKDTLCRETGTDNLVDALETLADMVERDYVKRESIEDVMNTDRELVAENIRLTAERDELKAMNDRLQVALDAVEGCDERCKQLEAERDEWKAKAEYCKRNDGLPSENDVSANDVDANDANATQDSREKLEADARALQARIWKAGANNDGISLSHIIELLDRQASITERDVRTYLNREDSELVQAKVDNLQEQVEHLYTEIAKRDKGIERLKRQRDEARADLAACFGVLAECGREREIYRDACGQLLDLADQMRLVRLDSYGAALVDERGEVVS